MTIAKVRVATLAALTCLLAGCAVAGPGSGGTGGSNTPEAPDQPSTAPSAPESTPGKAGEITPIADDELSKLDVLDLLDSAGFAARWQEPGTTLAIFAGGSGSSACAPTPESVEVGAEGEVIVNFAGPPKGDVACTMDYRGYGWTIKLDKSTGPDETLRVVANGYNQGNVEAEVAPADVLK